MQFLSFVFVFVYHKCDKLYFQILTQKTMDMIANS